jgi:hypothetical protein
MSRLHKSIQSLNDALHSSDTSTWLKDALTLSIHRDPVDAANDAQRLFALLHERAQAQLEASKLAVASAQHVVFALTKNL